MLPVASNGGFIVSAGRKVLVAVLVVVGLILVAGGIIYFVVKAGSLPSFIPGKIAHSSGHRNKRGIIEVVAGVVVLIIAVVVATVGRGHRRRY
jgi:Mn2+/Fe2+ NRAMP family transporter